MADAPSIRNSSAGSQHEGLNSPDKNDNSKTLGVRSGSRNRDKLDVGGNKSPWGFALAQKLLDFDSFEIDFKKVKIVLRLTVYIFAFVT